MKIVVKKEFNFGGNHYKNGDILYIEPEFATKFIAEGKAVMADNQDVPKPPKPVEKPEIDYLRMAVQKAIVAKNLEYEAKKLAKKPAKKAVKKEVKAEKPTSKRRVKK